MERWNGRIALVTGASGGIGIAICRELVKYGMTAVGCDINVDKIKELAEENGVLNYPGRIHPVKCDLTIESEILEMFEEIRQKFGRVDVCINSAGVSTNSPLLSGETSDWRSMFEVMVLTTCICNRESLKIMEENAIQDGQIINICSLGCHNMIHQPEAFGSNFYFAAKLMVLSLTEGLRREVKGIMDGNIRVASISPAAVKTDFMFRYFGSDRERYDAFLASREFLQASDIADAVTYILKSPPHVDINDIRIRTVQQAN